MNEGRSTIRSLIERVKEKHRARQEKIQIERNNAWVKHVQEEREVMLRCYPREKIAKMTDEAELSKTLRSIMVDQGIAPNDLFDEYMRLSFFTMARQSEVLLDEGLRAIGRPTMLEAYQSGQSPVVDQGTVDYYRMAHGVDLSDKLIRPNLNRATSPKEQFELDRFYGRSTQLRGARRRYRSRSKWR